MPSRGSTTCHALFFAPHGTWRNTEGPGIFGFGNPGPNFQVETSGPLKFPGNPNDLFAHDPATPDGPPPLTFAGHWRGPRCVQNEGSNNLKFRSSIAWLSGSLSTLRREGYPITTQDSLPGAGQALLDRIIDLQGSNERFQSLLLLPHPPLQSFLTQVHF